MQPKPVSTAVKGLIITLLLIIFALVVHYTGMDQNSALQFVGYGIFILGIILSIAGYAKNIDYNSTFGKYFLHGFAVSAIITCLMIIFMWIFVTLDPSIKEQSLQKAAEAMDKNPAISDEQKSQALEITKKFFLVGVLAGTLVGYLLVGTIVSLITAAIIKKDPRNIFDEESIDKIKPIE